MTNNRRRFTRVTFTADARLDVNGFVMHTDIIDLSLKGALLETTEGVENLALDQSGQLFFTLTSSTIEVVVTVQIKRLSEQFVGVSFESINLESAAHLKRLVELNLGGEDMIEREIEALVENFSEDK